MCFYVGSIYNALLSRPRFPKPCQSSASWRLRCHWPISSLAACFFPSCVIIAEFRKLPGASPIPSNRPTLTRSSSPKTKNSRKNSSQRRQSQELPLWLEEVYMRREAKHSGNCWHTRYLVLLPRIPWSIADEQRYCIDMVSWSKKSGWAEARHRCNILIKKSRWVKALLWYNISIRKSKRAEELPCYNASIRESGWVEELPWTCCWCSFSCTKSTESHWSVPPRSYVRIGDNALSPNRRSNPKGTGRFSKVCSNRDLYRYLFWSVLLAPIRLSIWSPSLDICKLTGENIEVAEYTTALTSMSLIVGQTILWPDLEIDV